MAVFVIVVVVVGSGGGGCSLGGALWGGARVLGGAGGGRVGHWRGVEHVSGGKEGCGRWAASLFLQGGR